jgi:hypothetical protein
VLKTFERTSNVTSSRHGELGDRTRDKMSSTALDFLVGIFLVCSSPFTLVASNDLSKMIFLSEFRIVPSHASFLPTTTIAIDCHRPRYIRL